MKLFRVFIALTAAFLTACASDDSLDAAQPLGTEDIPEDELVEVRLNAAANSTLTRAAVESDDNGIFELDSIGMFMLARYNQRTNPEEAALIWNRSNEWANWVDNMLTRATVNDDAGLKSVNLLFRNYNNTRDTAVWYPVGQWYSYRFYGYYPIQDNSNLSFNKRQRIVHFPKLDGKTDILWGRSEKADTTDDKEKYAYSARYFRQKGYSTKYPEVKFRHELMSFQFAIQGIPDENETEERKFLSANKMSIDTIIVVNAPVNGDLIVADLDDNDGLLGGNSNDGLMIYDWKNGVGDIGVIGQPLIDSTKVGYELDGAFSKKQVHNDSVMLVGQRLLLPVIDEDAVKAGRGVYRVRIRLKHEDGTLFDHEKPIDLNFRSSANKYEAGKCYKIVLQIAGPQHITMKASLKNWDDVDEHTALIFD